VRIGVKLTLKMKVRDIQHGEAVGEKEKKSR
jgi:hypothetical protein